MNPSFISQAGSVLTLVCTGLTTNKWCFNVNSALVKAARLEALQTGTCTAQPAAMQTFSQYFDWEAPPKEDSQVLIPIWSLTPLLRLPVGMVNVGNTNTSWVEPGMRPIHFTQATKQLSGDNFCHYPFGWIQTRDFKLECALPHCQSPWALQSPCGLDLAMKY